MVSVAQLVEPWIVIPVVVGSRPIAHPSMQLLSFRPLAQLVEQLTLNQRVVGSSPTRPTNQIYELSKINARKKFYAEYFYITNCNN